jgi:hypothetical protein
VLSYSSRFTGFYKIKRQRVAEDQTIKHGVTQCPNA